MKPILTVCLLMMASFFLGRHAYKQSVDKYIVDIEDLKEAIGILEENLLYCWNELPLGHIRHGSIDN